jgi:hypothetical protein
MQVGYSRVLVLPVDYSTQLRERQQPALLARISAEGPTCVLTLVDLQVRHRILTITGRHTTKDLGVGSLGCRLAFS